MTTPAAHLLLTLDYELFGDGQGSVTDCLLEPTRRLLEVADRHGAPVTFFVDWVEFAAIGDDRVRDQVLAAVEAGHDAQLHVHPQWEHAVHGSDGWRAPWRDWRIGDLPADRVERLIGEGTTWLREWVRPARPDHRPIAFRAGAWAIQPAREVLAALRRHGYRVDSTVAPGLAQPLGLDWYDFRTAPDLPWWTVGDDVCAPAAAGLLEAPIATARIGVLRRALAPGRQETPAGCRWTPPADPLLRLRNAVGTLSKLPTAGVVKLDFTRLDADGLIAVTERWLRHAGPIPVVAIGHAKSFGSAEPLDRWLAWAARQPRLRFSTFPEWVAAVSPATP